MEDKIIIALDTNKREHFDFLIKELSGVASFVKVGMELYYTFGMDIIKELKDKNFKVFLDLKLHDIPNTVNKSCKVLTQNGVDIINVHAAGGIEMMKAAYEGCKEVDSKTLLIGVTQLTSTDQAILNKELNITGNIDDTVIHYARNALKANLDGVVCSPMEVLDIKKNISNDFKCITPGIRLLNDSLNDQKRITTPIQAIRNGSDYLVIGRSVTEHQSPRNQLSKIIKELKNEFSL